VPRPFLKQFGDLKPEDFISHPIWIGCHTADYDEEWYGETTEETFRPWEGSKPVGSEKMYLVSARFIFADGSQYSGFVTPTDSDEGFKTTYLRHLVPYLF
jgi:hypothetical protein